MDKKKFYGRGVFAKKTLAICATIFAIFWLICLPVTQDIVVATIVSAVPTLIALIVLTAIQAVREYFLNMALNLFVSMDYNERRYNREL